MHNTIRVTVWNEFRHEKHDDTVKQLYPEGIHGLIAADLNKHAGVQARLAALDEPEHGLSSEVLAATDVLIWWGHLAHAEVDDAIVDRIQQRVLEGMGLIVLHSGHHSKIFRRLMGTSCNVLWREAGEKERLWVIEPDHPIVADIDASFVLPHEEMYGESFDIPAPDELVMVSWFAGGEVFRSGCCFHRGNGRIFYFRPGHETYPTFHDENVKRIISNAVHWAAPTRVARPRIIEPRPPLEALPE